MPRTAARTSLNGRAHWPSRRIPTTYRLSAAVIVVLTLLSVLGLCLTGMLAVAAFFGSNPIGHFIMRGLVHAVPWPPRIAQLEPGFDTAAAHE